MYLAGVSHNFSLIAPLHKHDAFLHAKNSKDHQVSELDWGIWGFQDMIWSFNIKDQATKDNSRLSSAFQSQQPQPHTATRSIFDLSQRSNFVL